MAKQARQRAPTPGPSTSLLDLWRGDLSEVIAAFLPLKAIATMPVSRRFRDRHPVILFSVARRHGALRAGTGALLDAVAATGRDWKRFCSDAADDAWDTLPAAIPSGSFTCSTNTSGGVRHIQIGTTERTGHGGGLVRRFDPAGRLCLRRVKYRFSFSDPTPDAGQSGMHAFAYFCMNEDGGLYVCPTSTGYALKSFNTDDVPDDQFPRVAPDTWYEVTITYDWTTALGHDKMWMVVVVMGEDGNGITYRTRCSCEPLTAITLYNFGPGVARYTAIEVKYSKQTSHDRRFASWTGVVV